MDGEKLVRMANRIGAFFAGQAKAKHDDEIAVAGIADHIAKFWDPRMRSRIVAYLAAGAQTPVDPLVRRALDRIPAAVVAAPTAVDVPQPIEPPDEPEEIDEPEPLDGFDLEDPDEIDAPEPIEEDGEEDEEEEDEEEEDEEEEEEEEEEDA